MKASLGSQLRRQYWLRFRKVFKKNLGSLLLLIVFWVVDWCLISRRFLDRRFLPERVRSALLGPNDLHNSPPTVESDRLAHFDGLK